MSVSAKSSVPNKVRRYAERIFDGYDKDLDGVLTPEEWRGMHGQPIRIAGSKETAITKEQWIDYVAAYGQRRKIRLLSSTWQEESSGPTFLQPGEGKPGGSSFDTTGPAVGTPNNTPGKSKRFFIPADRLPGDLPSWFLARDINGDGQLSLFEFSVDKTQSSMQEFAKLDTNGDGILTPHDLGKTLPKREQKPEPKPEPKKEKSSPKPPDAKAEVKPPAAQAAVVKEKKEKKKEKTDRTTKK